MAGGKMILFHLSERGLLLTANFLCIMTARMETAPRRGIDRARNISRQNDPRFFPFIDIRISNAI